MNPLALTRSDPCTQTARIENPGYAIPPCVPSLSDACAWQVCRLDIRFT